MKTKLLVVAALAGAVMATFAVRLMRRVVHDRATVEALTGQRAGLTRQVAKLEQDLRAKQIALGEGQETRGNASPAATAGGGIATGDPAASQPNPRRAGGPVDPLTIIADNPRMRAEHLQNVRASVVLEYGPALKAAGLSAEQLERFKDVEAELEETKMDLQAAVDHHELDPKSAAYKKLWEDYNAARVTMKEEVIGEQMGRYLDYYRSANVREYPGRLAVAALVTGEPVSAAQIDRAGDILAANSKRSAPDAYPGWVDENSLNWPAASEQLIGVLSPAQTEFIRLQIESHRLDGQVEARTKLLTAQFKKQAGQK